MTRKWHKGPPPHRGWWNASFCRDDSIWRWWDGERWSSPADRFTCNFEAKACRPSIEQTRIEWTDYYPPDARVPRINPDE